MDIELSYKLASQPKGDLARALTDEQDFADLIQRSQPFVKGTKFCGRGKDFCVQLFPKITVKQKEPSSDNEKSSLTKARKVRCRT